MNQFIEGLKEFLEPALRRLPFLSSLDSKKPLTKCPPMLEPESNPPKLFAAIQSYNKAVKWCKHREGSKDKHDAISSAKQAEKLFGELDKKAEAEKAKQLAEYIS